MLFATVYAPGPYSAITALSLAGAALEFTKPSLHIALFQASLRNILGTMSGMQNLATPLAGIGVSILDGCILDISMSFTALVVGDLTCLFGVVAAFVLIR